MDTNEPLKTQLHGRINDFSSLTRTLLELINETSVGRSTLGSTTTGIKGNDTNNQSPLTVVLDKLIDRDKEIQDLVETAIQMKQRQREIDWFESQIEARKSEIEDIQNRLFDAEKLLELTVHQGKQKLESIEQAQKGAVSPEKLIKYAHKISQASTAISPVGWQPSDPRRPFPQDVEMRAGLLGRLSSTGTLTNNSAEGDMAATEGSTSAKEGSIGGFVGMNQNNNQSVATVNTPTSHTATATTTTTGYQGHMIEQEPMSEDTSLSSSDEGM